MPLTGHVRFGGGPQGKGPACQVPRRVAYPAFDYLNPNLQKMQSSIRRKDACNRCRILRRHGLWVDATFKVWSDAQ